MQCYNDMLEKSLLRSYGKEVHHSKCYMLEKSLLRSYSKEAHPLECYNPNKLTREGGVANSC
jgi:hypothetical protein